MAIERLPIAILDPLNQRRADPLSPVGKHGVSRHHIIERCLLCPQRVCQIGVHRLINPETLRVLGHGLHADLLGQSHCHQVARLLDSGAQRHRPIKFIRGIARAPQALRRIHLNGRVHHHACRGIAPIQRRSIDKGLETRPRLPLRLGCTIEHRMLVGKPALHGQDTPGVHIHRHESPLHLGDLAQTPALEPARVIQKGAHENHIPPRQQIARNLCLCAPAAIGAPLVRPLDILRWDRMPVALLVDAFDADTRRAFAKLQHHRHMPGPI